MIQKNINKKQKINIFKKIQNLSFLKQKILKEMIQNQIFSFSQKMKYKIQKVQKFNKISKIYNKNKKIYKMKFKI